MKDTIFISHATPTDNIFATWLATKLELCGYKVWVDLNDLAPSVDFWNTIDQTIRNNAVKFIFVMSNASIDPNRDGVQKELAVADKIRRQNPNFIHRLDPGGMPQSGLQCEQTRTGGLVPIRPSGVPDGRGGARRTPGAGGYGDGLSGRYPLQRQKYQGAVLDTGSENGRLVRPPLR